MTVISSDALNRHSQFNETEVRFHILDPIIRRLGYCDSEDVYMLLEEKLEFPYYHIGHKSKKDLPLGFADYRAGLKGRRGSFVVEAKAATAGLGEKDIEQAHSYAAHAQVGANYFVLCDGIQFLVFETLAGPQQKPIVSLAVEHINDRFHEIENILSPESLEKYCTVHYDLGLRLTAGLGSSAKILSGVYDIRYLGFRIFANGDDVTEALKDSPQMANFYSQLALLQENFELRVSDGVVYRGDDGRIYADVAFSGATKNNDVAMRILGIESHTFSTSDEFISSDPNIPTVFETAKGFGARAGTMLPPLFGQSVPVETDVDAEMFVTAKLYKSSDEILGDYVALADYSFGAPGGVAITAELDIAGKCVLRLG